MNELALFAGAGGGILGGKLLGWTFQTQRRAADLHKHGVGEAGQVGSWWEVQPEPCSVVYGMAGVVDRLRPFGNGQVPSVAATAWRILTHNVELTGDPQIHRGASSPQGRG